MEILLEALIDALKILPFLFVVYIIIEIIEVKYMASFKANKVLKGRLAPLLGASVGLVPQCGFSVVATNLFTARNISMGTLLAVYIATSDEAIPILISNPTTIPKLLPILLIKFLFAIFIGYTVDFFAVKRQKHKIEFSVPAEVEEHDDTGCCHHKLEEKVGNIKKFIVHPLIHSLKIFIYIFIINIIFGYVMDFIGEEKLIDFLSKGRWWQPFLAGLIGAIPNCGSSVIITQMYALDALSIGATITGLSINSGVAFAVLLKSNKNVKENVFILSFIYLSSCILGLVITLLGF